MIKSTRINFKKKDNEVKAVLEVATFTHLNEAARKQSEELATLLLEKI